MKRVVLLGCGLLLTAGCGRQMQAPLSAPAPRAPARVSLEDTPKLPFASAFVCARDVLSLQGFLVTTDREIGAVTGTWAGGAAAGDVATGVPTSASVAVAAMDVSEYEVVAVAITRTDEPALAPLGVQAWAASARTGELADRAPSERAVSAARLVVERCGGEAPSRPAGGGAN